MELCHDVYVEFLAAAGSPLPGALRGPWIAPIRHAEADYFRPLRFGDRVNVAIVQTHLAPADEPSELTLGYCIARLDGGVAQSVHTSAAGTARPSRYRLRRPRVARVALFVVPGAERAVGAPRRSPVLTVRIASMAARSARGDGTSARPAMIKRRTKGLRMPDMIPATIPLIQGDARSFRRRVSLAQEMA